MGVWMYPLHKLVFQCRLNHNCPKPSVDRFSFQPPFCIGLSCAQFLGWNQNSKFSLCLWSIKCVIQKKFMPTPWRVILKGKYEGLSWHQKAHHRENTSMDNYYNLWLNPQAGKMRRILHSDWLPKACIGPAIKSSLFGHILNPLLTKLVWSRWLNIVLVHYIFINWDEWKHIKELGQYPATLTSLLVDNAYLFSVTRNFVI